MKLDDELLEIIKEVAALKVVTVKIGDAVDRIDGEQKDTRDICHQLVREAEQDIRQIDIKLSAVRERMGMDKQEVVMGDKTEIHGSEVKGSNIGTSNMGGDIRKIVLYVVAAVVVAVAGYFGINITTGWFDIEPQQQQEQPVEEVVDQVIELDGEG